MTPGEEFLLNTFTFSVILSIDAKRVILDSWNVSLNIVFFAILFNFQKSVNIRQIGNYSNIRKKGKDGTYAEGGGDFVIYLEMFSLLSYKLVEHETFFVLF